MKDDSSLPFDPLEGWILCEAPGHETSEGGILLPESTDDESLIKLKVLKVGRGEQMDGGKRREVVVDEGGTYWFACPQYSSQYKLTLNGVRCVVLQSKFVCGRAL